MKRRFRGLAGQIKHCKDYGQAYNKERRKQSPPDEAIYHAFSFKVQRTSRAATCFWWEYQTAITTRHGSHVVHYLNEKTRRKSADEKLKFADHVTSDLSYWSRSHLGADIRYLSSLLTSQSAQLRNAMNILKCSQRPKVERCGLIMSSL